LIRINEIERKLIIHATSQLFKKYSELLNEDPSDIDLKIRKEEVVYANNKVAENDAVDFKTLEILAKHLKTMDGKAYKTIASKFKKIVANKEVIERKLRRVQKVRV
jgi:hypothetical protein